MKLLIKISLRNLLRQKQRSLLLGIGIAFGMTILILANSFSHGISDILLNRIIKLMTGHFIVLMQEKPEDKTRRFVRDKERIIQIIKESVEGDIKIREGVITQSANQDGPPQIRAVGNGASSMIVVVGARKETFLEQESEVISGRIDDIFEDRVSENPIVIFDKIAENLNVGLHDTIRVRFSTVYGQVQAARFTVVAIMASTNPFMAVAAFTSQKTLKPLLGLSAQETGSILVDINNLDDPRKVIEQANNLHQALQPGAAGYRGQLSVGDRLDSVTVLGINSDVESKKKFLDILQLTAGEKDNLWTDEKNALISENLAKSLKILAGDNINLRYETKFEGQSKPAEVTVKGIFKQSQLLTDELVFVHPQVLYKSAVPVVPKLLPGIKRDSELFPWLLKEWTLLEIFPDQKSRFKKFEELNDSDWQGHIIEVATMYAIASEMLNMEKVLDIVTLVAVLVLFFIILIGVINTLRMTIRERTREIGTVRAIGMQRNDVRWSFMLEVIFLALFASLVGIVASFSIMKALSFMELKAEGMFSIFLVDRHLHFMPTWGDVVGNLIIILIIAALTSLFPANRAAKLSVADALRHVE